MADEQGATSARTPVDQAPEELAASFSSRFPSFRCTVCGNEDFEILNGSGSDYLSQYDVHTNMYKHRTASIETIGIACSNCGHIYQFALNILRQRLLGS